MGHLERRNRDREAVRQAIMQAAREIASKDGWPAVTIRKIAKKIEYTPPIVYEHFDSKVDLIHELARLGFGVMKSEMDDIMKSNPSPKKFLKAHALVLWDFAKANPDLYHIMFKDETIREMTPTPEMEESVKLMKDSFLALANGDRALAEELLFHWICLTFGGISVTIQLPLPPRLRASSPRDLYFRVVERFLESL